MSSSRLQSQGDQTEQERSGGDGERAGTVGGGGGGAGAGSGGGGVAAAAGGGSLGSCRGRNISTNLEDARTGD